MLKPSHLLAGAALLPLWLPLSVAAQIAPAEMPVEAVADPAQSAEAEDEDEIAPIDQSYVDEAKNREGLGLAIRASTLGFGAEGIYSLSKHFNVRAQANFFGYDTDVEEDGVKYKGELDFKTYGLLADWHPFAGSFRVSTGLYSNGNQIDLRASCPGGCEIGDNLTITTAAGQTGNLSAQMKFKGTAPYLGFGWGNAMKGIPLHFAFDIGVLFQGAPEIDLNGSGTATVTDRRTNVSTVEDIGQNATVQAELANEERNLREDTQEYKMYPVISLTIGYRFNWF